MLGIVSSPTCYSLAERGSMLLEVMLSLGILAGCTAATFTFLMSTARSLDSLEEAHRARFDGVACSRAETHVICSIGNTTITIVR
jgi:hypothetical protein